METRYDALVADLRAAARAGHAYLIDRLADSLGWHVPCRRLSLTMSP